MIVPITPRALLGPDSPPTIRRIVAAGINRPDLAWHDACTKPRSAGRRSAKRREETTMSANSLSVAKHLTQSPRLQAEIATGDALDVRDFVFRERMSALSEIDFTARSRNHNLVFEEIIGQPAALSVEIGKDRSRTFRGICRNIEQVEVASDGLATYHVSLVPSLWLATQRRNYRIFQHKSDPDIVLVLLGEWGIEHEISFDRGSYKKRKYRVQYGESDFAFLCRLLEDAGISFYFDAESVMVLTDAPQSADPGGEVRFNDAIVGAPLGEYVTNVALGQRVRPGKYTLRDIDYRRAPGYPLFASERAPSPVEALLERYHYVPGAFLFGSAEDGASPIADDKGATRADPNEGRKVTRKRLDAKRATARYVSFDTTSFDLRVGSVVPILGHPHELLSTPVLVVGACFSGAHDTESRLHCEAVSAAAAYAPPLATPKPKVNGIESATVVGPAGEEIHTDEFGRVRVHFHWDRESRMNEGSSCWIPVSQPWGGAGFGGSNLPRVGQEVIVDFLGGDPDRPVVVGRVYTTLQPTPYSLPDNKTRSGWRSNSSPGGGGFNEMMFEDKKGAELLSMQAERDMMTLVKHDQKLTVQNDRHKVVLHDETTLVDHDRTEVVTNDETIAINHDRKEQVANDETIAIGHDRKEQVANDEIVAIGHDRTRVVAHDDRLGVANDRVALVGHDSTEAVGNDRVRAVGNNEAISIGNDRVEMVAKNQATQIGENETISVGKNQSVSVGGNQSSQVAKSQSTQVGKSHSLAVAMTSSEQVGISKSFTVGASFSVQVAGIKSESVGAISTEQVGLMKTVTAGQSITLQCGAASIVLLATGDILINGTKVNIAGAKGVDVTGEIINLN